MKYEPVHYTCMKTTILQNIPLGEIIINYLSTTSLLNFYEELACDRISFFSFSKSIEHLVHDAPTPHPTPNNVQTRRFGPLPNKLLQIKKQNKTYEIIQPMQVHQ